MAKLPCKGDLVFFDEMLVGYIDSAVETEDGAHILRICVPFVDLPPAQHIRSIAPKQITLKIQGDADKKKSALLVPDRRILGPDGRPAK